MKRQKINYVLIAFQISWAVCYLFVEFPIVLYYAVLFSVPILITTLNFYSSNGKFKAGLIKLQKKLKKRKKELPKISKYEFINKRKKRKFLKYF